MAISISHIKYQDKFTIATYQDGRTWVAHNLGLDIVGIGDKLGKQQTYPIPNKREYDRNYIRAIRDRFGLIPQEFYSNG